ncbi:LicD family protein [Oribacterium sp. FC2011]|uniref:LicD family protein n=1 Tax=Oribacterium sp. FC2011 TaxID=1408311 RepID=UPI0004E13E81|nr:LicD family protein [Oribacterium sp. FC2011]
MPWKSSIIDDSFYQEEIRCGCRVSERLKKIWAVELDLMNELLRVCNKHDIHVCAFAGTILGAVRHKGFIPWDDDMDVCLTRDDYNKLCEVASSEFKYPYFLQTAENDTKFFCPHGRFRNSETTGIITWNDSVDYNNGIAIDVYVLDGYIENKFLFLMQYTRWRIIRTICDTYNSEGRVFKPIDRFVNSFCKYIGKSQEYNYWIKKYYAITSMYSKKTSRLGLYDLGRYYLRNYWVYKDELEDVIYVPFESIKLPIPREYDRVLKRIYGDYMSFPSEEERAAWHGGKIIYDPDISYKQYYENTKK